MPKKESSISGNSWVSVDIVIRAMVSGAILLAVILRSEHTGKKNSDAIAALQHDSKLQGAEVTAELKNINESLSELLTQQRIKNEIAAATISDRWTATMQEEYVDAEFASKQQRHPDMLLSDRPDVRDIQRRNLPNVKGMN